MTDKLLGMKAYGSIPHLPNSRLGPGDHAVNLGQARICCERKRDAKDRILVSEKVDGSCCAVACIEDDAGVEQIVALGRAGHLAQSSKFEQHQLFAYWVRENEARFREILFPGERIVGEWLAQAHGTRYRLPHEPFVVFDLMADQTRMPYDQFLRRIEHGAFTAPHLISDGPPLTVEDAMVALGGWFSGVPGVPGGYGFHGALDPVEGAVWRVERDGVVDYLAKFVRSDKVDGSYLESVSGGEAVWNWRPSPRVTM